MAEENLEARNILRKFLSKEAFERLSRIKLVKPGLALQLETYLVELFKTGKIKSEITEEQMIMILDSLRQKKTFRIVK
jgi:DNA-binding TFAR19-related protein (PDSD5 family)